MPQIDVNCPYCDDEYTVEIEDQSDGDIEEIECACGKSFDVEISFSVDGIVYKKDTLSENQEINSQQEKCGDTLTHQHRHGTHPEEGQVSKENDMATVDNTLSELSEVKDGS